MGTGRHNVQISIKGYNTGTSWISANSDSKLGKFCVCSTVCMHAESVDRCAMALANFSFRGYNFRAVSFSAKYTEIRPPRK